MQSTAAGRRKGAKKGKKPIIPGRPAGNGTDKHSMSVRNEPKGKRTFSMLLSPQKPNRICVEQMLAVGYSYGPDTVVQIFVNQTVAAYLMVVFSVFVSNFLLHC